MFCVCWYDLYLYYELCVRFHDVGFLHVILSVCHCSTMHGIPYTNGLMQKRRNLIANALELCLSCTNPPIWKWIWDWKEEIISMLLGLVNVKTIMRIQNFHTSFHSLFAVCSTDTSFLWFDVHFGFLLGLWSWLYNSDTLKRWFIHTCPRNGMFVQHTFHLYSPDQYSIYH